MIFGKVKKMKKQLGIILLVFVIAVGLSGAVSAAGVHTIHKKVRSNHQVAGIHPVNVKVNVNIQPNIIIAPSIVTAPIINSPNVIFRPIINSPETNYAEGNINKGTGGNDGNEINTGGIDF